MKRSCIVCGGMRRREGREVLSMRYVVDSRSLWCLGTNWRVTFRLLPWIICKTPWKKNR